MISEYVYFGLRPVAVRTGVNINIVHTDYLGSPRIITSGTNGGSTVWEWKNDNPYGNNKATGSIEFNLRFAGQYYDSESGLHYNIHRTYNPEIGRYMQSDPLGLSGGSNTYNYVNRNPLSNVDPLGLYTRIIVAEGDKNHIGHVAIDINGTTYGLMPIGLKNINAIFNTSIEGTLDTYNESEFIEHYTNGKYHNGKGFFDTIDTYDLQLTKLQEKRLEQRLKSQRYIYLEYIPREKNCATFISNSIKEIDENFEINKYPWKMKNYMENLLNSGRVKKGAIHTSLMEEKY